MADIAATDLVYTIESQNKVLGVGRGANNFVRAKIVFGTGALTYPATGIPLTKAKLGCPTFLNSLSLVGADDMTTLPLWLPDLSDQANPVLRGYEIDATVAGDALLVEIDAADTPAAQTLYFMATGY